MPTPGQQTPSDVADSGASTHPVTVNSIKYTSMRKLFLVQCIGLAGHSK